MTYTEFDGGSRQDCYLSLPVFKGFLCLCGSDMFLHHVDLFDGVPACKYNLIAVDEAGGEEVYHDLCP